MGIIISSFTGCGREYLKNIYGDKVKIFDAVAEFPLTNIDETENNDALESCFNKVMTSVDDNDIVFIGASTAIRNYFNENNVDYDLFYPSADRRGEFIENLVRKRTPPKEIQKLDRNFEKWVQAIDDDESPNCYKHKLTNKGEYIGNTPIIMQYINSLKQ